MTEIFSNVADRYTLTRPQTGTLLIRGDDCQWLDSGTPGFLTKPLFEDPVGSQRTWLMKIEAGAFAGEHTHDELEQVYVLDGSFYDQDSSYSAGDYLVRAPGAVHTAGSKDGALVLIVYSGQDTGPIAPA